VATQCAFGVSLKTVPLLLAPPSTVVPYRLPDLSKIKGEVGFKPSTQLVAAQKA
jgi:hypothetical protein